MGKVWKVIGIIAGVVLLLGALCVGVGFITGGDMGRITDQLTESYGIENLRMSVDQIIHDILGIQLLN